MNALIISYMYNTESSKNTFVSVLKFSWSSSHALSDMPNVFLLGYEFASTIRGRICHCLVAIAIPISHKGNVFEVVFCKGPPYKQQAPSP